MFAHPEIKVKQNTETHFSLVSIFFSARINMLIAETTLNLFSVLFQGCADVWNKTAVKQCCWWSDETKILFSFSGVRTSLK